MDGFVRCGIEVISGCHGEWHVTQARPASGNWLIAVRRAGNPPQLVAWSHQLCVLAVSDCPLLLHFH